MKKIISLFLCSLLLGACQGGAIPSLNFHPSTSNSVVSSSSTKSVYLDVFNNKIEEGCVTSVRISGNSLVFNASPSNGYRFIGWSLYSDFSSYFSMAAKGQENLNKFINYIENDTLKIYANFEKEYTIHYDLNGGSASFDLEELFCAEYQSYKIKNKIPTKDNYEFVGWEDVSSGRLVDTIESGTLKDVYLKAFWNCLDTNVDLTNSVWGVKQEYTSYYDYLTTGYEMSGFNLYQDEIVVFNDEEVNVYIRIEDEYYNYGRLLFEYIEALTVYLSIGSIHQAYYGYPSDLLKSSENLNYLTYEVKDNYVLVYINPNNFTYSEYVVKNYSYPIIRYEFDGNSLYSVLSSDYDYVVNNSVLSMDDYIYYFQENPSIPYDSLSIKYNSEIKNKCSLLSLDAKSFEVNEINYYEGDVFTKYVSVEEDTDYVYSHRNHTMFLKYYSRYGYPGFEDEPVPVYGVQYFLALNKNDLSYFYLFTMDGLVRPIMYCEASKYNDEMYVMKPAEDINNYFISLYSEISANEEYCYKVEGQPSYYAFN